MINNEWIFLLVPSVNLRYPYKMKNLQRFFSYFIKLTVLLSLYLRTNNKFY